MGNLFVVNAPFLFAGVWAIVKSFLDPKTRAKIKIIGGGFKPTLLEHIDVDVLPKFLGGNCDYEGGCISSNIGPWNDYEIVQPRGIRKKCDKPAATVEEVTEKVDDLAIKEG